MYLYRYRRAIYVGSTVSTYLSCPRAIIYRKVSVYQLSTRDVTHVISRTRPSPFLRVTLKSGCGLGTRLNVHERSAVLCVNTNPMGSIINLPQRGNIPVCTKTTGECTHALSTDNKQKPHTSRKSQRKC